MSHIRVPLQTMSEKKSENHEKGWVPQEIRRINIDSDYLDNCVF